MTVVDDGRIALARSSLRCLLETVAPCSRIYRLLPWRPPLRQLRTGSAVFKGQQLTSVIGRAVDAQAILAIQRDHGHHFNDIHLSACWSRLGKLARENRRERVGQQPSTSQESRQSHQPYTSLVELLVPLRKQTIHMLRDRRMRPRTLSNIAHGVVRSGVQSDALWHAIGTASCTLVGRMTPQELTNLAWSFASSGHASPMLFDELATVAGRHIDDFTPQGLSILAWSYATAGHRAPMLFDVLAEATSRRAATFDVQSIFNITWAFATANHSAPTLFHALLPRAVLLATASSFPPLETAMTAWAYTTAGHSAPALFSALSQVTLVLTVALTPTLTTRATLTLTTPRPRSPPRSHRTLRIG